MEKVLKISDKLIRYFCKKKQIIILNHSVRNNQYDMTVILNTMKIFHQQTLFFIIACALGMFEF